MRKLAVLLAFTFITITAFGQKRSDLQGPKYKNYKSWQDKTKVEPAFSSNSKKGLTGPEYKNYKSWKNSKEEIEYQQVVSVNKRANLTGPKYKNFKPWQNKQALIKEEGTLVATQNDMDQ
ncbi:hypothetical protein [Algibacter mikhailovii]|uniref:hypothetical protein n=1 Tax=Algibacter mikhailovii TaxID=425498 RepID=UPI00249596D9|nr:hypothetical protein [Algibacter mikhailovii]